MFFIAELMNCLVINEINQPQTANQSERPNSSINTRPRPKSAVPLSRRRKTINLRGLNERLIESKSSEQ